MTVLCKSCTSLVETHAKRPHKLQHPPPAFGKRSLLLLQADSTFAAHCDSVTDIFFLFHARLLRTTRFMAHRSRKEK